MGKDSLAKSSESPLEKKGVMSENLSRDGIPNESLANDHLGIENISVEPSKLYEAVSLLRKYGFNYLQCQGGYDVFLKRDSDLSIPSLYKIFKGSDWQERETYDMYGINFIDHPNPKRLLMPEDWRGWPLRKDYIQPDFYELQDAY